MLKTFGEGPRLAKRNIASPDFRRALWAIAAVLALLFVVFGVIFPSLSGGKVGIGQLASVKPRRKINRLSMRPALRQVLVKTNR